MSVIENHGKPRITIPPQAYPDWRCIDCHVNTHPGAPPRDVAEELLNRDGVVPVSIGTDSEVYMVRNHVWRQAGMKVFGGCLCIGCLERRLGRRLKPKDFSEHIFNAVPGTPRLLNRRGHTYTL